MKITSYNDMEVVEKYFKKTLAGVFINYPAILKIIRGIKGKSILDLGCGAGWLSRHLARKGSSVYAIDSSPKWISICKKQHKGYKNVRFVQADAGNLSLFRNQTFDIVIANMVFLSVPSKQQMRRVFKEAGRVLKKNGFFIFSDCHPVTNVMGATCTKVSGKVPGFSYFDEGAKYKSTYLLSDYSKIDFIDSHWSLEFYAGLLNNNGMVVERILEPKPVRMDPRKRFKDYRAPEYIIFKCRKLY